MGKGWFRRNSTGFGFRPDSWQGWATMLVFVGLIAGTMAWVRPVLVTGAHLPAAAVTFAILVFWLSILFLVIWTTRSRSDSAR